MLKIFYTYFRNQDIYKGRKKLYEMKNKKKNTWVFVCDISKGNFFKHKRLFLKSDYLGIGFLKYYSI